MSEREKPDFKKMLEVKMRTSGSGEEPRPEEAHDAPTDMETRLAQEAIERQLHVDPEFVARERQRAGFRVYERAKKKPVKKE